MISLKLDKDEVTPHLRKLLKQAETNGPLARVLGRAASNEIKKHFRARNSSSPNKLGGSRTNFWTAVGSSVQSPKPASGKILIPITHPAISQKVFGGTIRARKSKNLSIPIHAAAHGKSPRVFSNLVFAISRRGNELLGQLVGVKLLGQLVGGIMRWLYVLKPSITQRPDPNALPSDRTVGAAMEKAGDIFLRRQ